MSLPLVIVRPAPGLADTVSAARALGLTPIAAPLFDILPVAWSVPDPARFDGILAGSANAFRRGGEGLAALCQLPVFAVGEATANAARAAGFAIAAVGSGGLQKVLDTITPPRSLLRLAGEARVALAPPVGVSVTERVVYRAAPLPLGEAAVSALKTGAVVMLHSAEAARHFAGECDRLSLPRAGIALATIGPRVSAAAGAGWRAVAHAETPADAPLLALAARMCQ